MKHFLIIAIYSVSSILVYAQDSTRVPINEKHTITVETDHEIGKMYNLWDVRVVNTPELWGEEGFAEKIKATSKHINSIRT